MIKIKRKLIETIAEASRNVYPEEFIGLLRKNKKGEVAELLLIPLSTFGEDFSEIRSDMLPIGLGHCGSVHSHPDPDARPSDEDLVFFQKGEVNLIIGYPYNAKTVRAYGNDGKRMGIELVD
ncbi:putative metalloprotease [uncultured archaeon]|nr:putative metalloprotease [uncultured archaeon]